MGRQQYHITLIKASIDTDLVLEIVHAESEGVEHRRLVIIDIVVLTYELILQGRAYWYLRANAYSGARLRGASVHECVCHRQNRCTHFK